MHNVLFMDTVTRAAVQSGLDDPALVMTLSEKDNLTLPRPRVEIDFLPVSFRRSGCGLSLSRDARSQSIRTELYEAQQDVTANVLADDEGWLTGFERRFISAFPRRIRDADGNSVRIDVQKATFGRPPVKRVGQEEITVFTQINTLFVVRFTWSVTQDVQQQLITDIDIQPPVFG